MAPVSIAAHTISHYELLYSAGTHFAVLLTGGLITSGISGIFLLSRDTHIPKRQRIWLRVYILTLILLVLAFDVVGILAAHEYTIFNSNERWIPLFRNLSIIFILLALLITSLTDGLLVRQFDFSKRYDEWLRPGTSRFGVASWSRSLLGETSRSGKISFGCFPDVYGSQPSVSEV